MARLRINFKNGTITDNPLTNVATTINSAAFASMQSVSGSERLVLILDPTGSAGAPEIVHVTAHASGSTSMTVLRGQEGSTARQHAQGTTWRHGPTAIDFPAIKPSSSLLLSHEVYEGRLRFDTDTDKLYVYDGATWQTVWEPNPAWTSWTPTWTNLTVGNGTVTAKYTRVGRTIHFRLKFTLGSTSTVGTLPRFSLPVESHSEYLSEYPIGAATYVDSGTAAYDGVVQRDAATTALLRRIGGSGSPTVNVTATAPFAWATGDYLMLSGSYEAAS